MKTIEVSNKSTENLFIRVPKILYKNDPVWIAPLDNEVRDLFDPDKNSYYINGDSKRWILKNNSNQLIGRIAAFYNNKKAMVNNDQPTGGIGFFECINDKVASGILFDTAKDWLNSKGMEAMDGPINIGETDSNWGLLVQGFTHYGYGMNYNHQYYKDLFESYGFKTYFEQYTFHLDLTKPFPERFWKIAEWVLKRNNFTFEHFKFDEKEKYIQDLVEVYNVTWNFKADFIPLKYEDVLTSMNKARFIIDEELVWYAYHKGQPIAFFVFFPDINQILKYLNGKMHLLNMVRFLYLRKRKISRFRAIVAGVHPRFQNSGIESAIFYHMNEKVKNKPHYKEIELAWVGDFNKKMQQLYYNVGGKLAKIHRTYRYLFDRNKKFERFMPEEAVQLEMSEV